MNVESFLTEEIQRHIHTEGVTKRTAVRLTLAEAIRVGVLKKGGMIPPEKRLTELLGVSLGTVQAALQQLQQNSMIVRRRGDGSRVASTEPLGRDIWHFRLQSATSGAPLRVQRAEVDIRTVAADLLWSEHFPDYSEFVRIRRRLEMDDQVKVGADMVVPAHYAVGLEETPPTELETRNIRPYLVKNYGLDIRGSDHRIATGHVTGQDAVDFGLVKGTLVFEIFARAVLSNTKTAYVQRILAPCDSCAVTF